MDDERKMQQCGICGRLTSEGRYGAYTYGYYRIKGSRSTQWGLVPSTIYKTEYFEIPLGEGKLFICNGCIRQKLRKSLLSPLVTACVLGCVIALPFVNATAHGWLERMIGAWEPMVGVVAVGSILLPVIMLRALWSALSNYLGNRYLLQDTAGIDTLAAATVRGGLRQAYEHLKPNVEEGGSYEPAEWEFEVRPVHPDAT